MKSTFYHIIGQRILGYRHDEPLFGPVETLATFQTPDAAAAFAGCARDCKVQRVELELEDDQP